MIRQNLESRDPDIVGSLAALKRAAKAALELGLRTRTPVWVIKNGRIVDLTKSIRGKRRARNSTSS